jgi:hypothetical protein
MPSQHRLKSLQNKKALLANQIEDAEKSPFSDPTYLRHLKKQKLEIKEILTGIRADSGSIH